MSQQNLFKPLSEHSKAAVVETVNALVEWNSKEVHALHIRTAIAEYYTQLAALAHESSLVERELTQENLAEDLIKEEEKPNE